jgi:hypothetical protein
MRVKFMSTKQLQSKLSFIRRERYDSQDRFSKGLFSAEKKLSMIKLDLIESLE